MSARSKRGSAPKLRARAVGVPQSSVSTAVTSAQELKAEVERLRSVFSEAKNAHLLDPTPEQAKIVARAEMDFTNAVIRMCQAAVDAAPDSEVAAKRRELRKAEADKLLMAAKLMVGHCEGAARSAENNLSHQTPGSHKALTALRGASNARAALSEAKIGLLSAELEVLRAEYLIKHLDSSDVDANASVDVINKYREFAKAKAQLDVEKHKAAADLEAEKHEAAAKCRVDEHKTDLDAARATYRARNPHSTEADEEAFFHVRRARLEAEERQAAVELEAEKKQAAAKLAVEERKADLAVARAMYLFTHPGSSEADANASVDVCEATFVATEARFPTVDCTSKAEVGSVLQDVRKNLEALMEAKLRRDMPSADLKVKECNDAVSTAERNHTCTACASISLGADPESKTAFPSDPATHEDAVPEAELAVKPAPCSACPGLASCPQVWSTRHKLRMAEEERDMLRLQLEVEMRGGVFSAAKSACRLLFPNLEEAGVDASDFVSFYLHHLRKAEADRDVKKAQLHIASIENKFCFGDVRSLESELSQAEVAKCEAIVAAAQAAHRCANLGSTDAAANASPDVRLAVAELEVAKRQVAVNAARNAFLSKKLGLSEKDADASPDVCPAVAELEVAKRQAAVDAARATMFRRGLSEKDADASTDVVNMLQALHKASEDLRVLPAQIKLDAYEAAVSDASMKLLSIVPGSEGDVDTAFSEVMTTLKQRADAAKVMAVLLTAPMVKKRKAELDSIEDAANSDAQVTPYDLDKRRVRAKLELLIAQADMDLAPFSVDHKMFEELVSEAAVVYGKKNPGLPEKVIHGSDIVRRFKMDLKNSLAAKELRTAEHKVNFCVAELDIAKIDFVSEHPGVTLSEADIAASVTVSEKLELLDEAENALAKLETKDIRDRSMWVFGLPGPVKAMLHYSAPASPVARVNDLAVVSATMAALFPFPRTLPVLSRIWHLFHYSFMANCKNDIVELVRAVLKEAHDLSQQDCHFGVRYQFLLETAHDFVLARDEHLESLLAVIDVMIPDDPEEPFGDIAYHQMFTSLMVLHNYHGVAAPMGILSTYNHWQFCWLDLASPVAEATSIDEVKKFCVQAPSATSLKLCVSEVLSFDDPRLVKLLVSFLLKVCATPPGLPSKGLTQHYTETGSGPKANGPERSALKLYQMVRDDASDFFAVRLLDYNAEGVVLLMATETGACCTVKIPPTATRKSLTFSLARRREFVVAECKAWGKAYPLKDYPDVKVRVAVLNNSPVLIMPFFEQLSDDDWENPDTVSMVREHIHALALRGVFHRDVQRRHVVWAHGREDVRLIGWGGRSTASDGERAPDADAFTSESMRQLSCS